MKTLLMATIVPSMALAQEPPTPPTPPTPAIPPKAARPALPPLPPEPMVKVNPSFDYVRVQFEPQVRIALEGARLDMEMARSQDLDMQRAQQEMQRAQMETQREMQ
ncbi:MAG: hypothetical protein AABZ80_07385, partial [Gemmatimonadota bacterium]